MAGFATLFLIIGVILILYNLMVNFSNMSKIVMHCFHTNSLGEYWSLFFKYCISGRAIYSSIIAFLFAVIIFIIITPFVIVSGFVYEKKMQEPLSKGLQFLYPDQDFSKENKFFQTNISFLGINVNDVAISGLLRKDYIMAIIGITSEMEKLGKKTDSKVLQNIKLFNSEVATIPVLLIIDHVTFPLYFIYDEQQKQQFRMISEALEKTGFKKIIYFSRMDMY